MSYEQQGGCLCGNVRYSVQGKPVLSVLCFCRDCLSLFGCDGYPGMMIENQDFSALQGKCSTYPRTAESGRTVTLNFCPDCGTTVWGQTELGMVSVVAGTLDNPDVFEPEKAVFTTQAPAWARIPEGLDRE